MGNIEEFRSVQKWLNRKTDTEPSRRQYRRAFKYFLDFSGVDPDKLISKWRDVRFHPEAKERFVVEINDILEDYLDYLLARKSLVVGTRHRYWMTVRSFMKTFKIPVEVEEPIWRLRTVYHNRAITKEEIRRILGASRLREKAFYILMAETGLRPDTLVKLQYKHIKEDFQSEKIPMKIDLPAELLKDRVGDRFAFIGEDGYKILKEYLGTLGELKDDDYLFQPERRKILKGKPLPPHTFTNYFRTLALKLGITEKGERGKPFPIRLYCLRKYFRNNFRGDATIREFFMGHSLEVDEHYLDRNIEKFRKEYERAYPDLRIFEPQTDEAVEALKEKLREQNGKIAQLTEQLESLRARLYGRVDELGIETEAYRLTKPQQRAKELEQQLRELRNELGRMSTAFELFLEVLTPEQKRKLQKRMKEHFGEEYPT